MQFYISPFGTGAPTGSDVSQLRWSLTHRTRNFAR